MRHALCTFALTMTYIAMATAARAAALPADVPQKHWAAPAVRAVAESGLMTAPKGKFAGAGKVTREELIGTLARTARLLERRKWPGAPATPVRAGKRPKDWKTGPVTRYRLAAVLARVIPLALAGLPDRSPQKAFDSEAVPKAPSLKGVPRTSPAYRELEYLAKRRMVWTGSVLLKPGKQPVTGEQLSTALAQVIAGLNGAITDEPQNMPEISLPRHP